MKIAITGASGYIGGHLTRFFEEKGDEVVSLGRDLFKEQNFDALCRNLWNSVFQRSLAAYHTGGILPGSGTEITF